MGSPIPPQFPIHTALKTFWLLASQIDWIGSQVLDRHCIEFLGRDVARTYVQAGDWRRPLRERGFVPGSWDLSGRAEANYFCPAISHESGSADFQIVR
jgi:hypothetical protein